MGDSDGENGRCLNGGDYDQFRGEGSHCRRLGAGSVGTRTRDTWQRTESLESFASCVVLWLFLGLPLSNDSRFVSQGGLAVRRGAAFRLTTH